jgi:hydroxymethylbilane synthase
MKPRVLKLGTRGSALALWQANWVKKELEKLGAASSGWTVELVPIKTTGDKIIDVPLANMGGKGLFTKELDEALLEGQIDLAVHSLKDVPVQLPEGIDLAAVPQREDPRDAFLSDGRTLEQLPAGARIGTSSLRRQVQLRHHFPSLDLINLRGNVDTRLRKLAAGEFDGIVLAVAGLKRLGHESKISQILDDHIMISAVGQGAMGVMCRRGDQETHRYLAALEDGPTRTAITAERALLRILGGSCQVPIGGIARVSGNKIHIRGLVASLDGKRTVTADLHGDAADANDLGLRLGQKLLDTGAGEILAEII